MRAGVPLAAASEEELRLRPEFLPPDLFILDDASDRTARAAALARLSALPPLAGVPYLVLAWDSDIDSFSEAITRGAAAYMVKPVSPEELVAAVRRILSWTANPRLTERRRRLRRPLLLRVSIEIRSRRVVVPGQILDVSSGGCRLDVPESVAPGDHLRVVLMGHDDTTHVTLGGEVRWSNATPSGRCEVGVRFTGTTALLAGKLLGFANPGNT